MRYGSRPDADWAISPVMRHGVAVAAFHALYDPTVTILELRVACRLQDAMFDVRTPRRNARGRKKIDGIHYIVLPIVFVRSRKTTPCFAIVEARG